MKTTFLILALTLITIISSAQEVVPVKPSEWSQTNKDSVISALELETVLKEEDLDNGDSYMDSLIAVMPSRIINTNDTLEITDLGKILYIDSEFDLTMIIPLNTFPEGATINMFRIGTGEVAVAGEASVTLHAFENKTSISGQWIPINLVQIVLNTWIMSGGIK